MTGVRWQREVRIMRRAFPGFEPFLDLSKAGFAGQITGGSGRIYSVTIRTRLDRYPAEAPTILIEPVVGPYVFFGALSVCHPWRPEQSTFALRAIYTASYLHIHG